MKTEYPSPTSKKEAWAQERRWIKEKLQKIEGIFFQLSEIFQRSD